MKYFGRVVTMAMLAVATMIPGLAGPASAQSEATDLCSQARASGAGSVINGYPVVWLTGGSGDQIVLGPDEGGATLSGGSGNDLLCAWGGNNILDGGSGNDVLIARGGGNMFLGGSGNDTMIGLDTDGFNGGSGRNTSGLLPPITIDMEFQPGVPETQYWYCRLTATVNNLDPTRVYTLEFLIAPKLSGVETSYDIRKIGAGITSYTYAPLINMSKFEEEGLVVQVVVGEVATGWVTIPC